MQDNRRKFERHDFSYYMPVTDDATHQMLGHIADISLGGFKIDTQEALPVGQPFRVRLALEKDVSPKSFITFEARSRWCNPDRFAPSVYNVGFQITKISPTDHSIFKRVADKYSQ